jgi:biopolymer transport protein ExbD
MRFPHNTKVFRGQLDAAPFMGMLFLLILFLLMNSALVFTPGVPIHLPEAVDLPGAARPSAVVAVDESGHFYFENQLCDEARLKERLRLVVTRSREPVVLVVQADKAARMEVLVRLGLLAQSLGIREMIQAVRPPVIPVPVPPPPRP